MQPNVTKQVKPALQQKASPALQQQNLNSGII